MLGFLKKLFGFDKETMKDAGVQIEQQAPYKVEPPAPEPEVVPKAEVIATPVKTAPAIEAEKPAAMTAKKKPRGPKKPQGLKPSTKPATPKPAAKPAAPKRGRKPKAK